MLLNAGGAPLEGHASWDPFAASVAVPDGRTARIVIRQLFGLVPPPLLFLAQRSIQRGFQRQVVREFIAAADEAMFLQPDDLRRLPVPAALLWGLADTFLPIGSLEFFSENLPKAPMRLLRRCGHLPQRERPLAVARFIRRYLAQIAANSPAAH
jgi:pimeloyl-ACP methyl ester carboxylesterase